MRSGPFFLKLITKNMESKQVLIYDNQHCFSRLLKKVFGRDTHFKIYKKFDEKSNLDDLREKYSFVFFMIYSEDDLFDYLLLHDRDIPIVVCSFNQKILNQFGKISNINLIDISQAKPELVKRFDFFLKSYA